ncbi:MAG: DUF3987 domain-containing protein [Phycisphaeraceae bacterium]|nr:DUF3987 domain-containing protein [Phycisphaeraceae bacterium]
MSTTLSHDATTASAFLKFWRGGESWLTSLPVEGGAPRTSAFAPDDVEGIARWLATNSRRNVYFSVNTPSGPVKDKAKEADIGEVVGLHVDVDPRPNHDLQSERARIRDLLLSPGGDIPAPSAIIDTGGGFSAFWKFATTQSIEGPDDVARLKAMNKALARRLGGDKCENLDRIMRLPGTVNHPNADKRAKGRTVAQANIVELHEERLYAPEDFDHLIPVPAPAPRPVPRYEPVAGHNAQARCDAYLDKLDAAVAGNHGHDQTFHAACVVHKFGLDNGAAWQSMQRYNARCQPPWKDADLRRKLDQARERVERDGQVGAMLSDTDLVPQRRATTAQTSQPATPPPLADDYRPFPIHLLPKAIRNHVRGVAARMDVDVAFLALPAMAVFAAAIGNAVRVVVKKGWFEPACLRLGVVAFAGTIKTETMDVAIVPMFKAQRQADAEYEAELAKHAEAIAKAEDDHNAKKKSGEKSSKPPKPPRPLRRQWVVSDATPEALVHVLRASPRGVLAFYDELALLFASFARYDKAGKTAGEAGASLWKTTYSGKRYVSNRRGTDGAGEYVSIEAPLTSVCGCIQPGPFRGIVDKRRIEDGFASRFFWAQPPYRPARWIDDDGGDDEAEREYADAFFTLASIPLNMDADGGINPIFLGMTRPAQAMAREYVNGIADRLAGESNEAVRAAWAKLKGGAFRLALVFHLADWAGDADRGAEPGPIPPETLERAIGVAHWFADEALRVYAIHAESEADAALRRVRDYIVAKGGRLTPSELSRGMKSRYHGDAEAAERDCQTLVEQGRARWEDGTTGRPTRRIVVDAGTETPSNSEDSGGFCYCDSGDAPASADGEGVERC